MSSQTFADVTPGMLERIAAGEDTAGLTFHLDDNGRGGGVVGATPLGEVEARFDLDPERAELVVTIRRKPAFLPPSLLWSEVARALARAREACAAAATHDGAAA